MIGLLGHFGAPAIMLIMEQLTHFAVVDLGVSFFIAALFGVAMMLNFERTQPSVILPNLSWGERRRGLFNSFVVGLGFGTVVVLSSYCLWSWVLPFHESRSGLGPLAITLLAGDLTFYLIHRFFTHALKSTAFRRWCRARHSIHHAVTALDFFRGGIFSLFDPVFFGSNLMLGLVGALLGVPLAEVLFAYAIFLLLQNTHHVNHTFDIGPLRFLFMDNHAHKLHHCRKGNQVNLAAVLSIWDRLFGTYYEDKKQCAAFLQQNRIEVSFASAIKK